jgi:hypothetical protein
MFGWFAPKCPVTLVEKAWTEWRMCWLAEKLGIKRLLEAEVLTPTDDHFPHEYCGTQADAWSFMRFLARHMGVDSSRIELEIVDQLPDAVGHYESSDYRPIIRVVEAQLEDPQRLLATLAHELAHEVLLGGGLISPEVEDHEWITDLAMAYLGVGIFAANATLTEASVSDGNWNWWSLSKQGYLPSHIFGYAMALFAFMREEEADWQRHLRPDAAAAFRKGLRFLRKTNNSLFHPETKGVLRSRMTVADRIGKLQDSSPSVRLANLWELREQRALLSPFVPVLQDCVRDSSEDIQAEAIRLLARAGAMPGDDMNQLVNRLWRGTTTVRAAAAHAIGILRPDPALAVPNLAAFLGERTPDFLRELCLALGHYGTAAASAVPNVLAALLPAYREGDQKAMDALLRSLLHISPDARAAVRKEFASDPEIRDHLLATLSEQSQRLESEQNDERR